MNEDKMEADMIKVIVVDNYEEVSKKAFEVMKEVLDSKANPVLGLATGSSPIGLYQNMIADCKATNRSYKEVITFNLDEYIGLPRDHQESYYTFMNKNLFSELDVAKENIHIPDGSATDPVAEAKRYEEELAQYTLDIQVLGIGSNGHIGFNEPGTKFDSVTHVVSLQEKTIKDNARFFDGDMNQVPKQAISMGIGSIIRAKKILVVATGENKADAVYGMVKGPVTTDCPASVLQNHSDVIVIVDQAAASKL